MNVGVVLFQQVMYPSNNVPSPISIYLLSCGFQTLQVQVTGPILYIAIDTLLAHQFSIFFDFRTSGYPQYSIIEYILKPILIDFYYTVQHYICLCLKYMAYIPSGRVINGFLTSL